MLSSVCILNDRAFIAGGQDKVAIDSAILLAGVGIHVTYFAPVGPIDSSLEAAGVVVECLDQADILNNPNRFSAMTSGLWNRSAALALRKTLSRMDPASSVIHCHGYAKALSPSIGPVIMDSGLSCLFTMHEYFLACPNGGFFDYRANEICRRRPLGLDCLTRNCDVRNSAHKMWRVARQVVTWGPGRMPRGLRYLAYLSETQRAAIQPYLPEEANLFHLPNPVASPDDGRLADPSSSGDFIFVGRMSREKGSHIFAEAAARAGVKAVMVGEGPDRELIAAINRDAVFTGWKSPTDVRELMLGARALVFPSLWYETFGLVAYEAISNGLPVITARHNSASEAIVHNRNGLIVDHMDVDSLARALVELSDDRHPVFSAIRRAENRRIPTEGQYLQKILDIFDGILLEHNRNK